MGYEFYALDVETANEQYWSICQVGIARFVDGEVVDTWQTMVDPETHFRAANVGIHGIQPEHVAGAIKLPELLDITRTKLGGQRVAHHMPFDRLAFCRCSAHCSCDELDCHWIDTASVARQVWQQFRERGYSLANIARTLEITQSAHHDALNDAITAGKILCKAFDEIGYIPEIEPKKQRLSKSSGGHAFGDDTELRTIANSDPNPLGIFFGEVIVFTGELSIPRVEAAHLAYSVGCNIDMGVTRATTMLVVGTQDLSLLAGFSKSSKHRKAEELIEKGQHIRIISEDDFFEMVGYDQSIIITIE